MMRRRMMLQEMKSEIVQGSFIPEQSVKEYRIELGRRYDNLVIWSNIETEFPGMRFIYDCIVEKGEIKTSIVSGGTNTNPTCFKTFAGNGITIFKPDDTGIIIGSTVSVFLQSKEYNYIAW